MDFSGKEVAMFYQLCTRQPSWFLHSSDILGEGQLHICYRVKFPANTQWYLEVAIWKTLPQSCVVCSLGGGAVSKDVTLLLGLIRTKSCISFQSPHWWSNTIEHKFLCSCTLMYHNMFTEVILPSIFISLQGISMYVYHGEFSTVLYSPQIICHGNVHATVRVFMNSSWSIFLHFCPSL